MTEVKKITQHELEQLHAFTIKHFVEYYDLQTELTDHLANAIEARWQQEPNLTFDDALKQEFKKFGIFGFMTVVEQRQLALSKRYYKLFWGYFKEFFKLPKVILSVVMVAVVYKAALLSMVVLPTVIAVTVLFLIGRLIYMGYRYKKKVKKTGQRWMLEEIIYRGGGLGFSFILPYQLNSHFILPDNYSDMLLFILSVWTVLFALYIYVILVIIPGRAKEHLENVYPEYKLQQAV